MVALGLILLVLSGVLALGVVLDNTDPVSASAFGVTLSDVNVGAFFLVGAVTGLVFMLGLALMVAGAARKRSRRVETKRTVRDVRTEKEQLEEENAALRARLEEPYPAGSDASYDRDRTDGSDDRDRTDDRTQAWSQDADTRTADDTRVSDDGRARTVVPAKHEKRGLFNR